jgi:hypothetical protein
MCNNLLRDQQSLITALIGRNNLGAGPQMTPMSATNGKNYCYNKFNNDGVGGDDGDCDDDGVGGEDGDFDDGCGGVNGDNDIGNSDDDDDDNGH